MPLLPSFNIFFPSPNHHLIPSRITLHLLYLISYLLLFGDQNPTFQSSVFPPSVLSMTNLPMKPLFSELQQPPRAVCGSCVTPSPLSALHPLSHPSPPPHHFAPSTGCSCGEHAQCSFLSRCSGGAAETGWGRRRGGRKGADKSGQRQRWMRRARFRVHLQILRRL